MLRTSCLAVLTFMAAALPASAESIGGGYPVRVTSGGSIFQYGGDYYLDLSGIPMGGGFSFSPEAEWPSMQYVSVYVSGGGYDAGAGGAPMVYDPYGSTSGGWKLDSLPGRGADTLTAWIELNWKIGSSGGSVELYDPSGAYFETGIIGPGGWLSLTGMRGDYDDQFRFLVTSLSVRDDVNVPEPSSLAMTGLALAGLAVAVGRRRG